ncbi:glycine zipper 2TM domain-containing protein [Pedobacter frigidisoli]|uniref:Glycine zipper 2TM domain-containing protein n=1 Tax=Pedobacter frigidisoli TaxID=2530455 RepID=A0A4V2MM22_9SPHI|nr:YMGG-like glycine zipper-containing protein [Pedobacter frigidisoli]TCD04217.1 glycine zipper 2TM domain-containing protein [Pedobacter frigidisoli]
MKKIFVVLALSSVMFACNNKAKEEAALKQQEAEKQLAIKAVKDSLRLDSFKKVEIVKQQQEVEARHQAELAAARRSSASSTRSSTRSYASSGGSSSSYGGTQPTAKKKGWSDAAKGTVIGAAAGAVGGALIDKKKGRGAIIGGLAGAGGGYLIGRGEDRKSGRVQPKN